MTRYQEATCSTCGGCGTVCEYHGADVCGCRNECFEACEQCGGTGYVFDFVDYAPFHEGLALGTHCFDARGNVRAKV